MSWDLFGSGRKAKKGDSRKILDKIPEDPEYLKQLSKRETESEEKKRKSVGVAIGTTLCIAFGFIPRIMVLFMKMGTQTGFKIWVALWNLGMLWQFWLLLNFPAPKTERYVTMFLFFLFIQFWIFMYYNYKILWSPVDFKNTNDKTLLGYSLAVDFLITVSKLVFVIVPALIHWSNHLRG